MFGSLLKAAVGVATLPLDIAADTAAAVGFLDEQDKTYTEAKAEMIKENIDDACAPDKKD